MKDLLIIFFLLMTSQNFIAQESDNSLAVIHGTEVTQIYSEAIKDTFQISVALPADYEGSGKQYPVVYLTDPFFTFGSAVESARANRIGGLMPDVILVGIGYTGEQEFTRIMKLRTRAFTIKPVFSWRNGEEAEWAKGEVMGKAPEFLTLIKEKIIPFIEQNYRTTEDRTYVGHSGGGFFGTYVLFKEPEVFNRYLLSSPSLWGEERNAFDWEQAYAAKNDSLNARIYLSVAEEETHYMVGEMRELVEILRSRNYQGLELFTHIFNDENHFSVWPIAVNHGLRVLFEE